MESFTPLPGSTVNIDVSSSSQRVSLALNGRTQVRVMNNGTATVWLNFGGSSVSATTTAGMPVGPGVTEIITLAAIGATTNIAAIAAGSTGKVYFTPGSGI